LARQILALALEKVSALMIQKHHCMSFAALLARKTLWQELHL
jgi:hypothetical protein